MIHLVEADPNDAARSAEYCRELEHGNIVFFPSTPFDLPESDRTFLRGMSGVGAAHHKNIAYRTTQDKVTGFANASSEDAVRLLDIMRRYSQRVIDFTARVLRPYKDSWKIDYASFRSEEEQGRDLPLNKRNDLLHVDAFPSRPTNGDMILRVFTNINPKKTRDWMVSDSFEPLATRYAAEAGLPRIAAGSNPFSSLLSKIGVKPANQSNYDRFMLGFHEFLKHNAEYQKTCAKYHFEFPPNSTWMVFTDVVPHAVLAGQYALEQTFIVARRSLVSPEKAPAAILERIAGRPLTLPLTSEAHAR